jgi:iron(III) transport system ATP-binding protein
MKDICATGLAKAFGKTLAVDSIDFEVPAGSLVTLLGPSGCGKTTTLRLIAGLEKPDAGEVRVGERVLTSTARGVFVPPDKRRMGMVFQTYAIWPHMSVFENVEFPLRERRVPSTEIRERDGDAPDARSGGLSRPPRAAVSGGQQQRVALAALADPDVLLLDEPFSNLDARLREDMRLELKEMQKRVGVTTLFVTHDQAEAMILSDRVFVMNAGRIAQDGSPRQIYEQPRTRFVMDFLGQVDHVDARVVRTPDGAYVARLDGVQGMRSVPLATDQPWHDARPWCWRPIIGRPSVRGSWQGLARHDRFTMYPASRICRQAGHRARAPRAR